MIIATEDRRSIRSVADWFELAPPKKGALQWRDGRSAKELAKAWFRAGEASPPLELLALLATHPDTADLNITQAVPECRLRLDEFAGEKRNADLWLRCEGAGGVAIATVEAKAGEEFGPETGGYYDSRRGVPSNLPARVELLCAALFGRGLDSETRPLRYQLLHGAAATLISAGDCGAGKALFLVHQFARDARCLADWRRFARLLGVDAGAGQIAGPVRVPGGTFVPSGIPLYLGYAVSESGAAPSGAPPARRR